MRRLRLFHVAVVLALGLAVVACSEAGTSAGKSASPDPAKLVDYPETLPLVQGQFDNQHYPKYDEVVSLLKGWAVKFPGLVDVYTVGKTYEGRDIWQITITNESTGPGELKPAMLVGGAIHSEEAAATVAALDFANTLLTGYGNDPEITALLNTRAFYVKPVENPDGAELFLGTALSNRSSVRPFDDDGDGHADEDPPEDLNGDHYITQMRRLVGKGQGNYIIRAKFGTHQLMGYVGQGRGDYQVFTEGVDTDADGKYNEDGIGGLDLNRNYPDNWRPANEATGMGWTQSNSGEFPLSEPETRSTYLFIMTHPNISIVQSMHTQVPMHIHPPATSYPEESMNPVDIAYYNYFDAEGSKLSGYKLAGSSYHEYSTAMGGKDAPMFGTSTGNTGTITYNSELWGSMNPDYPFDFDGNGVFSPEDGWFMDDNIPQYKGKILLDWKPYEHPTLGKVEMGGWNPKFWTRNPPAGEVLAKTVGLETSFNMLLAKSLPLVEIADTAVTTNPDGTHTLSVTITNEGFLPDAMKQAYLAKIVRPAKATIQLGEGMSVATYTPAVQEIGFFAGALPDDDTTFEELSKITWARSREVSWVISGPGNVAVTVQSTRGGTSKVTATIP